MSMKCRYLFTLWTTVVCVSLAQSDVRPVSDVLVQQTDAGEIWLRSIRVNDYEVPVAQLVTGASTGVATAVPAPFNRITNADNLDLNVFAGRNREDPAEWRITGLGGQASYWDSNGEQPDFFLFETNGNDDIDVQAILADGLLGRAVSIPKSIWGDTGLRITASVHKNQKIMGLSWSLTDLLDGQGRPLTNDQSIQGIQITSPGLDPACFCAVQAAVVNQTPLVDAGEDLTLFVPETSVTLSGAVSDDGWDEPNGYLQHQWSWLEGPGPVVFEPNAFVLSPLVVLQGGPGVYVLELNATDGALDATDQVTVYLQAVQDARPVVINEILSDSDPAAQTQGDWLELYNPADQSVDVAGYFLTDDLDRPTRWRIPGGNPQLSTIGPRAFLRIWAGAGFGSGLQAGFRLNDEGETVALYGPDGQTQLDTVTFSRLPAGISWGREPDGSDRWLTLLPSPGRSNTGQGLPLVADTKFSVDRGFFSAPIEVNISCSTEDATIVYTTDGSLPTPAHGTRAASPASLAVSTTTVLRAMAFKDGMRATDVDTQTYLFLGQVIQQPKDIPGYPRPWTWLGGNAYDYHDYEMDPAVVDHPDYRDEIIDALLSLPTMSLAVEPSEFAHEDGFYWGSGEAPCSMELIFPHAPQENVQARAGVEPHSHDRLKRSLRLNFRSEYGDAKLETSLIQQGSLYGDSATERFDRLILRGGNNRCWARIWNPDKTTYAIDQFYRDTQLALTGYGSRGAFVHLYINGLYWGLYNPAERTDHWFSSEYFGGEPEHWFAIHHGSKGRPGFHGESTRYQTLMNQLITQDQSDAHTYARTCSYVDVENFCDYLLCTWWMGVGDWPGNNWYAGCRTDASPLGPTPLRFFAWDGEWSWDASRAGGPGYVHPDFRNNKTGGNSPIPKIWHALRQNTDFMMLFADRVYGHFFNRGPLAEVIAQQRWLRINEQLRSAVVAESARWGDAMENQGQPTRTRDEDWQDEVDAIHNMIEGNSRQFINHLRQQGYYPALDPPTFSQRGGAVARDDSVRLTNPQHAGVVYYTTDGLDPRSDMLTPETAYLSLFGEDAPKRVLVPTEDIHPDWRGLRDFNDSQWIQGWGGVGYERGNGYESYIRTDTEAAMFQTRASCYIRIPFQFAGDPHGLDTLSLYLRYDDGFVAYLNGVEVARANVTGTPDWQFSSSSSHSDSEATVLQRFGLNHAREHLRSGDNILAIHGLNRSTDSSDFLISALLEVGSVQTSAREDSVPGAQVANGPIYLPHSCTVNARVLDGTTWSALNTATFVVGPVGQNLRISEIMYHPPHNGSVTDPNTEFIELVNIGSETVNLNLVQFSRGISFVFPPYDLDPGARALVVKDLQAFTARYGAGLPIAGQYQGSLSNSGERIELIDPLGDVLFNFRYKDDWFLTTDGLGHSLEVKALATLRDLSAKDAWKSSSQAGGTPGQ